MNSTIFKQLFLSYGAVFLFLLMSLSTISYIELLAYLNDTLSRDIDSSLKLQRKQLESNLNNHLMNLTSWSNLHVMDDLITGDADLRITQTLETIKVQYQLPGHLYAFSVKKKLISSDRPIPDTTDFSIWYKAIENNSEVIDKHTDPVNKEKIIALFQPVYASYNTKKVIGYLIMSYPWREIEKISDIGRSYMRILLFNNDGHILTEAPQLPITSMQQLINHEDSTTWITTLSTPKLIPNNHPSKNRIYKEINLNDKTFFMHELSSLDETPITNLWHWISLTNKSELHAPLQHALLVGVLLAFFVLIVTLFIIFIISRKISKPIEGLTRAAVDTALTLDLSNRVPVYGRNELSRLAEAFNQMCENLEKVWDEKNKASKDLQSINQSLESKIAERTKHLAWQATHDDLTGLPNRALLSERLNQAIARVKREGSILAIMFIDLDGFKEINDSYGHEQGDLLLIELAQRFMSTIREPDTIARLGGDEFVILMQVKTLEDLESPLTRFTELINAPIMTGESTLVVSSSIGVTIYPDDCADVDSLIRHADQAMYEAKQKGRNQIQFFDVEMEHQMHFHYKRKNEIKKALQNKQFVLYFQPQVNLKTKKTIGAEALIRWQHPDKGILSPERFLPEVEGTNLIIDIGRWVIQQACQQLQEWNQLGLNLKICINIASKHLQHPEFFDELITTLKAYPNVQADQIILEVTESTSIIDIEKAKNVIQKCLDHKIKVALDDFGTGYSSLSYLRHLPISILKIDKSFVINMLNKTEDKAIVESTIKLAHIFEKQVVAEGIETSEHYSKLQSMNCTFGQGFGISKPLSNEDFLIWIKNNL